MEAGETSNEIQQNGICGACETFRRNEEYLQKFCVKYEGRILLQNKGIILYFILELSRVEYELDNSGLVCVMSEGTTVPVRPTQMLYLNLNSAAVH